MKYLLLALLLSVNSQAVESFDFHQRDKQRHFAAGCLISTSTWAVAKDTGMDNPIALGLSAGIAAGMLKEVYDYHHPPHMADPGDALATAIGSFACVSVAEGVSFMLHKNQVEIKAVF
jgi:hypothetical protein